MNCEIDLSTKKCIQCHGGIPKLKLIESLTYLKKLKDGWQLHENVFISKQFDFKNFLEAMNFANKITEIAESESHHPDLIISWGKCIVKIWTHKIDGLSESDFILASKIDIKF